MSTVGQNGAADNAQPAPPEIAPVTPAVAAATVGSGAGTAALPAPVASRPVASLRLPPFSMEETELWLSQVECALGVAGITDDLTRYQVLVVNLPTEVAVQVRDIISSPAPSYTALTTALRERLAQSRASRLEALLRHQQLGDQRPSELLRRMQGELAMAGVAQADDGLLRTLYKQRLPHSVRAALSLLSDNTPLAELASAADRFMEANAAAPSSSAYSSVCAIQQPSAAAAPAATPAPAASPSALDQLTASVAALTAAVSQMQTDIQGMQHPQHRSHSRGRSASRSAQGNTQRSPSRSRLCYYHWRFGSAARKCAEPCSWQQQQPGNDLA